MCQAYIINSVNSTKHHEVGQYSYLLNFMEDKIEAQGGKVTHESFPAEKWWNRDSNPSHPSPEAIVSGLYSTGFLLDMNVIYGYVLLDILLDFY